MNKPGTARKSSVSSMTNARRFDVSQAVAMTDLQALADIEPHLHENLNALFGAQKLSARLCLMQFTNRSVALFGLADYIGSDVADTLLQQADRKGYRLAQPSRYVVDPGGLVVLARYASSASAPGLLQEALPSTDWASTRQSRSALTDIFQDLLVWGVRHGASDIHINPRQPEGTTINSGQVCFTVQGRYVCPQVFHHLDRATLLAMLAVIWMDVQGGNGAVFDPTIEQQGRLLRQVDNQPILLRWASLAADDGPSICLRLLDRHLQQQHQSLGTLGYRAAQITLIERAMLSEGGAIIFAGRVGSGKSTTLASLIASLPRHRKVITLEDPVEYHIPGAIQNSVVRTLDVSESNAYAAKLRTLKRSAMHDVLLGEIRDRDTGQAFMDLAGSGVNVYTTLHAPSAPAIPHRLASDFIGVPIDFLLTPGSLQLLVYQTLIPTLCAHCALSVNHLQQGGLRADGRQMPGAYWSRWLTALGEGYQIDGASLRIRNPQGCRHCQRPGLEPLAGYGARTVVAELIEPTLQTDFLTAIQHNQTRQWQRDQQQQRLAAGLEATGLWHSIMDEAVLKALQGEIDPRDIERYVLPFDALWSLSGGHAGQGRD